ncbi:MAG: DUF309 domain-containing protein, partial [Halolamina sp.]
EYHDAHDAWEGLWLDLENGTEDERLLHGLIQFTAAVFHARNGNWTGAVGLADSARGYLRPLAAEYRGVNVDTVRSFLAALEADPERIERARPPALRVDGEALLYDDLSDDAAVIAAGVVAAEYGYDESAREAAARFARAQLADGAETGAFKPLVLDFLEESAAR